MAGGGLGGSAALAFKQVELAGESVNLLYRGGSVLLGFSLP